jgi:phenylalanine-4-hydroxylase
LSSFGELEYCLTDKPELRPFNPAETAIQPYPVTSFQPVYYVAESFEDAKKKLRDFAATLNRPFDVYYNPYTQRVDVLDSPDKVLTVAKHIQSTMNTLTAALARQCS